MRVACHTIIGRQTAWVAPAKPGTRLLVACTLLLAGPVFAAGAGEARPSSHSNEPSAEEECGADRRCRIERLKRINPPRRQEKRIELEQRARSEATYWEEEKRPIRYRYPWSAGLRLGRVGLNAGFSLSSMFRVETGLSYKDFFWGETLRALDLQATYLPSTGTLSPYLSAGFTGISGEIRFYDALQPGLDQNVRRFTYDATAHALRFAAGLDFAPVLRGPDSFFGWWNIRLGIVFQPHIYHRARTEEGLYNPEACRRLETRLERDFRFHPEFFVGIGF